MFYCYMILLHHKLWLIYKLLIGVNEKMTRKEYIFSIFNSHKDTLRDIGVKSIGIFGSVVRDQAVENSDYDILVEFNKEARTFKNFNRLCDFLDGNLEKDYDLITMDGLSPYIGKKILQEVEYVSIAS